jgi:hypothetical protein
MGHGAWGIGHWPVQGIDLRRAWGIGHWALSIPHFFENRYSLLAQIKYKKFALISDMSYGRRKKEEG